MTQSPTWSAIDAVRRRVSCRTYDGRPLAPDIRETLAEALRKPPAPPFGTSVRLALVDRSSAGTPARLGTYGVIRGADSFLVGAVRRAEHAEEDFGFVFEWAILRATSLGLGTCWLGGTLRRGEFAAAMGLEQGEFIPAVTPVGHAADRLSIVDRVTRWGAGSASRRPWSTLFFDGSFQAPLSEAGAGRYAEVLEAVRRAPSASNRQPWRVVRDRDGSAFHLFLQRTAGYGYPGVDLQRLDMGIAMCHFEFSARELGLGGGWGSERVSLDPLPRRTMYVASWRPGMDDSEACNHTNRSSPRWRRRAHRKEETRVPSSRE